MRDNKGLEKGIDRKERRLSFDFKKKRQKSRRIRRMKLLRAQARGPTLLNTLGKER